MNKPESQYVRLSREYADMENSPIDDISAIPKENTNLTQWECVIIGPQGTFYENGVFLLDLILPPEYPHKCPIVKFRTQVYHPNIDTEGNICVSILKDGWAPTLTISKVLLSISSLFMDPNPGDPLRPEVAREYQENIHAFEYNARNWTAYYATENQSFS